MSLRYTLGQSATDNRPREMVVPDFDAFENTVIGSRARIGVTPNDTESQIKAKKNSLPYVWHAYQPGKPQRRNTLSAGELCFLPLDLDGATAEAWGYIRKFVSWRGFAYTTASHRHPTVNGEYRLRLILSPSRPVLPHEKERLLKVLQAHIMQPVDLICDDAVKWDERVYNPAQVLFLPDESAEFWTFQGDSVDVDAMLALAPQGDNRPMQNLSNDLDELLHVVDLANVDDNTFEDLKSAMWYPSVLSDAEANCGKYGAWIAMGCRLAWFKGTQYESKARDIWIAWSAAAPGGDEVAAAHKWDSDGLTADRTGYPAIFRRAQKAGWINPGAERMKTSVALLPIEKTQAFPHVGGYGKPGKFVVEGLIPEGVTMAYGASSSFKSYFILSLLCRVALKKHRWGGRNLKGGAVLYVAAEGGSSVMPRVGAWADKYHSGKPIDLFYTLPLAVDLSVPAKVNSFINEIKRVIADSGEPVRIVAIDTLSQSMMEGEENSASDIAKFMAGATHVFNATGAAVVIVHHSGKDSSKGMRGSSAGFANADAVIRIERVDNAVNVINEKQRTGPSQPTRGYAVPIVPLPESVIAENGMLDDEYTSTEGEVYDPVKLETERVFEDIPMAEIAPLQDDIDAKVKGNTAAWAWNMLGESEGAISREVLRNAWEAEGNKWDTLSRALRRMKEKGFIVENSNGMITNSLCDESHIEGIEHV